MTDRIRHAVVRSTGATTFARKYGDRWTVSCLNHANSAQDTDSRTEAWKLASHPQDWCPKCKAIAAGKADKITEGKLDIPKLPTKAPAKKAPAKKATAATKKAAPKTAASKKS